MAYLYPELKSKKAYKEALKTGMRIIARDNTPWGQKDIIDGSVVFEGPHYPKPHRYYGTAIVKDGIVIKISWN